MKEPYGTFRCPRRAVMGPSLSIMWTRSVLFWSGHSTELLGAKTGTNTYFFFNLSISLSRLFALRPCHRHGMPRKHALMRIGSPVEWHSKNVSCKTSCLSSILCHLSFGPYDGDLDLQPPTGATFPSAFLSLASSSVRTNKTR